MTQWLMIQNFAALDTICSKTAEKQATYRTPKGAEKQLDYILLDRKNICCSRDAEANDMVHMESDHRSAVAHYRTAKRRKAESTKSQDDGKMRSGEAYMFEERYAELERKFKHAAETATTAQKPKMTESSTILEQAEGGVVAEVAAAHHFNED